MAWLSRCGITYEQLSDPKSWRTDKGVPSYCSVYSYLRLQQHAAALKSERVIFMAIPDQLWLHNLMAVRAVSPTGGAFDYWRSLQVRAHLDALKGGNIDEYHEVMCNIAKAPGSMA